MNNTLDYFLKRFNIDPSQPSPISVHFSRFSMVNVLNELGFTIGAEIGTESGYYATRLCQGIPNLKLYCIDAYEVVPYYKDYETQEQVNEHYEHAKNRLSNYKVEFIKKYSMEAVKQFEPNSLDFVFIDANHYFEWIVNDVIYWSRIVRPGGIVFGHDYGDQFHVKWAVDAYMGAYQINPWFVLQKKGFVDNWLYIRQEEDKIY